MIINFVIKKIIILILIIVLIMLIILIIDVLKDHKSSFKFYKSLKDDKPKGNRFKNLDDK